MSYSFLLKYIIIGDSGTLFPTQESASPACCCSTLPGPASRVLLLTLSSVTVRHPGNTSQVWNFAFPQGEFAQVEGERLGLADDLFAPSASCWSYATRCPEYRSCFQLSRSDCLAHPEHAPCSLHKLCGFVKADVFSSFICSAITEDTH